MKHSELRHQPRHVNRESRLYAVYIIQGVFAIITSFSLTEFIRKEYSLCDNWAIIVYVLTFLPYGYSLPENVV